MANSLPTPDPLAKTHSERVQARIRAEIAATGPISFARFMQLALYEPGLGYYSAGARKFGRDGDFVTAPEISPLFSWSLANQCVEVLITLDGGDIFELGAGSGIMALEILRELERQECLPIHYYILEVSADLKHRQQQLLQSQLPTHLYERICWLENLPKEFTGIILANEVLDAMPVHKFKMKNVMHACCVDWQNNQFVWQDIEITDQLLLTALHQLEIDFSQHYESEINLLLPSWIASLADCLQRGLILLIDYGFPRQEYYHPCRSMGTLMCHYQHRAHSDPFFLPGLQDITAHVDFTAVALAAYAQGLSLYGFTHQAAFLLNCGITQYLTVQQDDPLANYQRNQQVKQLTLPSEMGELFKVIGFGREIKPQLLGFSQMNQLMRLSC